MHLVVFDIDGTLVQSTDVDARCYVKAVSDCVGASISSDWATYRESTDAGILDEILDRHGVPVCRRPSVAQTVKRRFIELLAASLDSDPDCCRPVPGARTLLRRLEASPDVWVAIATGGWSASAILKLNHAGVPVAGLPFASSDDAEKRKEILTLALQRSRAAYEIPFRRVYYVGDGTWDVEAASALGLEFVGMACGSGAAHLSDAGAEVILNDFADHEAFIRRVCAG